MHRSRRCCPESRAESGLRANLVKAGENPSQLSRELGASLFMLQAFDDALGHRLADHEGGCKSVAELVLRRKKVESVRGPVRLPDERCSIRRTVERRRRGYPLPHRCAAAIRRLRVLPSMRSNRTVRLLPPRLGTSIFSIATDHQIVVASPDTSSANPSCN